MTLTETAINIIAEGTRIEGSVNFENITRIQGILLGEVTANDGSVLVLGASGMIEGNINADVLMIDGYVRGDIVAKTRVVISCTGRVIGNIRTASLVLAFGAYFEGRCSMNRPEVNVNLRSQPLLSN